MASRKDPDKGAPQTRAERRAAARADARTHHGPSGPSTASRLARRWAMPAILAAAAVVAVGIVVAGMTAPPKPVANVVRPVEGAASAPVVIAEYSDYQCDYCGRWARDVEASFRTTFVDPGQVRFEWHDYAWEGQESLDAANAARCAGDQGRFWEMHDLLYQNQGSTPNAGAFTKDALKSFGTRLGLDTAAYNACVDAGTYLDAVKADSLASQATAGSGTPAFTVNGKLLVGYQSLDQMTAAIQAAGGIVPTSTGAATAP